MDWVCDHFLEKGRSQNWREIRKKHNELVFDFVKQISWDVRHARFIWLKVLKHYGFGIDCVWYNGLGVRACVRMPWL